MDVTDVEGVSKVRRVTAVKRVGKVVCGGHPVSQVLNSYCSKGGGNVLCRCESRLSRSSLGLT
jgi:hypothetical protein